MGRSLGERRPGGKGSPGTEGLCGGDDRLIGAEQKRPHTYPAGAHAGARCRWPPSRSPGSCAEPSPGPGWCGRAEVSASTLSLPDRWPPAHGERRLRPGLALKPQQPLQRRAPGGWIPWKARAGVSSLATRGRPRSSRRMPTPGLAESLSSLRKTGFILLTLEAAR